MASSFVLPLLALSFLSLFNYGLFANEISNVEHAVTTETNKNDVKGLAALQSKFSALQFSTGDPCTDFLSWFWVRCNDDSTPRVTELMLSAYGLSGTLPNFSSMDALEKIDLSFNFLLTGPIPDFLGTLPNLTTLNLAYNDFTGTVPASLSKNKNLDLTITGNSKLCASDKSCDKTNTPSYSETPYYVNYDEEKKEEKKKSKLPIILGILIPLFVIFWVVVGFIAISHHKRKSAAVAAMVAARNDPEMKGSGGEINLGTQTDQQQKTYNNETEHVPTN